MRSIDSERFMKFVSPEPNSGCWLWTGFTNRDGYGTFNYKPGQYAHRAAYVLFKGGIPEGKEIDHLCRVRCCVNPDHLEAVSRKENIMRSEFLNVNTRKIHCPKGHPYSVFIAPYHGHARGMRQCRICLNAAARRYRERKKAGAVVQLRGMFQ